MKVMLEFIGSIEEGEGRSEFVLRVFEPQPNPAGQDYFVELQASPVFAKTERIFGVDETQARELAIRYLTVRLEGRALYDPMGRRVAVRDLLGSD